jgi:hypothetical protein
MCQAQIPIDLDSTPTTLDERAFKGKVKAYFFLARVA